MKAIERHGEHMTIEEAYDFIEKVASYGSILGLESMENLLKGLGNPQDQLKFIHIAGTNGKGSTAAFITHILAAAGYRVGRYISPSVFSYEEKIQITEEKVISSKEKCITTEFINEHDIMSLIKKIQTVCEELHSNGKAHPTVFEVETAMSMLYFLQESCDIVVLEVGLGGKLDATNVIQTTECGVITSISMDHMEYLGDTLEQIAIQKAGIIKEGIQVAAYDLTEEAMKVIEQTCRDKKAILSKADFKGIAHLTMNLAKTTFDYKERKNLVIKLPGANQVYNAVVAIHTMEALRNKGYEITEEAIFKGLSITTWNGRFEVIKEEPLFIIDGAHNVDAARSLASNIKIYLKDKKIRFIMGVLKDKDYNEILHIMNGLGEMIYTITPNNPRALSSETLAEKAIEKGIVAVDGKDVKNAVNMAFSDSAVNDVIIAFGSLSYLGELKRFILESNV
ncbi:MAG: bifunctional folylpolyglutamate synthase/dihydrofolate synthase [Anaerocolumna sp.]